MKMSFRNKQQTAVKEKPIRYASIEQLDMDTIEELQTQAALYLNRYRDVTSQNFELREKLKNIRNTLLPMIEKEQECRPENTKIVFEETGFDKEDPNNAQQCAEVLRRIIYYQVPLVEKIENTYRIKESEFLSRQREKDEKIKALQQEIQFQKEKIGELIEINSKQKKELEEKAKTPIQVKSTGMKIVVKPKESVKEPAVPEADKLELEKTEEPVIETIKETEKPEEAADNAENKYSENKFEFDDNPFDIRVEHEEEHMREIAEPTYLTLLKEKGIEMMDIDNPKFDKKILHQGKEAPLRYIDFVIDSIQFFDDLMENVDDVCLVFSDAECYRKGHSQFTKWIIRSPRRKEIKFSITSMEKLQVSGLGSFNHL